MKREFLKAFTADRLFESWRKSAERNNPRLLFLDRAELIAEAGPVASGEQFPDHIDFDGLKLPLSYRFTPGVEEDGVTDCTFGRSESGRSKQLDWLVPGLRAERMAALLKSLPKAVRRNFVPFQIMYRRSWKLCRWVNGRLLKQ